MTHSTLLADEQALTAGEDAHDQVLQAGSEDQEDTSALDKPITSRWLIRFSLPTILSTLFMSSFVTIDGIFAARVIDSAAFAVTNLVWPYVSFAMAVGFMLSIGGSAIVAKRLGEGQRSVARANFTTLTLVTVGASALLAALGLLFPDLVFNILGVDELLRPMALEYLRPMLFLLPSAMMGFFIQQYFITEGKANVGFMVTLIGGLVNLGLNFLFIMHFQWGLHGAALSTGIGWSIPAVFGLVYFWRNRRNPAGMLYFVRPSWDGQMLGKASVNGASEMITMLASSVTFALINNILMDRVGYTGVAAAGIMLVGQMIITSTFIGFATGIAPIISFNFGKGDQQRLQRLFKRSLVIITIAAVMSIVAGWFLAHPLTLIYVPVGSEIYDIAVLAFRFGLLGFLFMGINTFASIMFTALNNGLVSGLLSFFRTLVFVVFMASLLPAILDANGIWLTLPAAELLAFGTSVFVLWKMRGRYNYA